MIESAGIEPGHVVVELGAGTGPVTRRLGEVLGDNPFLALEPNPEMAKWVREQVPQAEVVEGFAQDLPMLMEKWGHPKPIELFHRALRNLEQSVQDEVMAAVLAPKARWSHGDLHLSAFTGVTGRRTFRKASLPL